MKLVFSALGLIFYFQLVVAEAGNLEGVVSGFEQNIDQQVVRVFPVQKSDAGLVFLYKKYLEPRKVKTQDERSKTIGYEILNTRSSEKVPFLSVDFSDNHFIGKVTEFQNGFLIPVVHNNTSVEVFNYTRDDQKVESANLKVFSYKDGIVKQLFYLEGGFLALIANGSESKLVFQAYGTESQTVIDLTERKLFLSGIDDITELDGRVYIVGSVAKQGTSESNLVLFSFDKQFSKESLKSYPINMDVHGSRQAEFILTTHAYPSLQVLIRKERYSPPTLHLFKLDHKAVEVWKFDFDEIEGNRNLQVAGVCQDQYVFSTKIKSKGVISDSIEFRVLTSGGKESRVWKEQLLNNGSLISVGAYPTADNLFVVSNYSKMEDTRRQDGWYSWLGYRVDKLSLVEYCK